MNENGQFLLGLAFAIPLSIIANLFTPKIQDWLSRHSRAASERQKSIRSKEQSRIDTLVKDDALLHTYLLFTVLMSTMIGSATCVFFILLYMLGTIYEGPGVRLGVISAQSMLIIGGLMISKFCMTAINITLEVVKARKAARKLVS